MIFDVLQQVLNELFLDVQESNFSLYAGDLFESSYFKLTDVFLKPSFVNLLQLPFELSAGYVGNITVEGLVGAVAGWPLDISISDLCLVLKPNHVKWGNEQLLRYAKELLVALFQCFGAPAAVQNDNTSFISPVKWIWSRIQPVKAKTNIQLERVHLRVESQRSDNMITYGIFVPLISFAPREVEEQILQRRQQPGVTYAKASDMVSSKLLSIENMSSYTDLDASPYWIRPVETQTTSTPAKSYLKNAKVRPDSSLRQYTFEDALEHFRTRALMPFIRAEHREIVFARVIWIKLDFERAQPIPMMKRGSTKLILIALDIATEAIAINIDFDQIAVIREEIDNVVAYFQRIRTWHWRPSCIDRLHHTPPKVKVSASALFPLSLSEEEHSIICHEKQVKSRLWFRSMWRYAFRCIIDQQQRVEHQLGDEKRDSRIWWRVDNLKDKKLQEFRRQRYIHLYARYLSPDAMEIALYGRRKALFGLGLPLDQPNEIPSPPSPRRRPLPRFDALSHDELWEFSDFIASMSVSEQRICRALAEQQLRKDYTTAPPSPSRKISSTMEISVFHGDLTSDHSVQHSRRYSVDSIKVGVTNQLSLTPEETGYRHKRGMTIALTGDEYSTFRAFPTESQLQSSPTSNQPSREIASTLRSFQKKLQPVICQITPRLENEFFPAWVFDPTKVIPLFNWHIGPVTVRLNVHAGDLEFGVIIDIGGCGGAVLLSKIPFLSSLMEVRIGLLHVTLTRQARFSRDKTSIDLDPIESRWISSNYIRTPEDGFLYFGVRYSAKDVESGHSDEDVCLKGRLCIGPITIDCSDAAKSAGVGQAIFHELQMSYLTFEKITHFSLLRDACHRLFALLSKQKHAHILNTSPRVENKFNTSGIDHQVQVDQPRPMRSSRMTRLFHALLLPSSTFAIEVGTLELKLIANTSFVENSLSCQNPTKSKITQATQTFEDVNIRLQETVYRLQNCPSVNQCIVDIAGVRVVYQSTQRGRAAVIRYLAHFIKH
ncbi:putative vacuolar protein sorting-associated protein [Plasmopara halstedii]